MSAKGLRHIIDERYNLGVNMIPFIVFSHMSKLGGTSLMSDLQHWTSLFDNGQRLRDLFVKKCRTHAAASYQNSERAVSDRALYGQELSAYGVSSQNTA